MTAGGTCTPATSGTCFSQTWPGVNIPSIVGGNTAYIGMTTGANAGGDPTTANLTIASWSYTVNSAPSSPSYQTYTSTTAAGTPHVAAPTFSPAAGTYSGTQNVTPSSSTTGAYFCAILTSTMPSLMPQTDNAGACTVGTYYASGSSIPISSRGTLYVMAGVNVPAGTYQYTSSNLTVGTYTINTASSGSVFSGVMGPGVVIH